MAKKYLALALVAVLFISMALAVILPSGLVGPAKTSNSQKYAGYTEMQVYNGTASQLQAGAYVYVFQYYPTAIIKGTTVQAYLTVCKGGVATPTQFSVALDDSNDYYGITFAVTQVSPDYVIVMVNTI